MRSAKLASGGGAGGSRRFSNCEERTAGDGRSAVAQPFGLTGALPASRLRLYDGNGVLLREVTGWRNDPTVAPATIRVGAFAFAAGSKDSALVVALKPGAYTMQVLNRVGSGVALAEIYDSSVNPQGKYQRLVNISTRGFVGTGEDVLIGGFVVTGNSPKKVLIRGAGPALAQFGVGSVLLEPLLKIYDHNGVLLAQNNHWETALTTTGGPGASGAVKIAAATAAVGAFAFDPGSADAAVVITLAPGAYTAQVSGVASTTGVALIEFYEIPN